MIKATAPGKLYIAGEYAVLTPGYQAILVAVDRFATVTIKKAKVGHIESSLIEEVVSWKRVEGAIVLEPIHAPFEYIVAAIQVTENYALVLGKELTYYYLNVTSELNDKDGRKYGLGSSAAVTVATIKALCHFYEIPYTNELIYKLSVMSHLLLNSKGSFGDIAASIYGGWIVYTAVDRPWLLRQRQHRSLMELIQLNWPRFKVESLIPPKYLRLLIGWTGMPSKTEHLVEELASNKRTDKNDEQFLMDSEVCVNQMVLAIKQGDTLEVKKQIRIYRFLLQRMGRQAHVLIETPALTKLCDIAEQFSGAAKSSGAGGGDCGIVMIDNSKDILPLLTAWKEIGIINLPIHVYNNSEK